MDVYVVREEEIDNGSSLEGIYKTLEKAKEIAELRMCLYKGDLFLGSGVEWEEGTPHFSPRGDSYCVANWYLRLPNEPTIIVSIHKFPVLE